MSWKSLDIHSSTLRQLQNILTNRRLAHAYIFHGSHMSEIKQGAIEFAKAINCERQQTEACDHCSSCLKIQHYNHPDVVTIEPQGAWIRIEPLRELKKRFHYQASTGITRVVLLEAADQMRLEAANSLLKFLEEPPSPMVAILITQKVQSLLPTIQSRCQKIHFIENQSIKIQTYIQQGLPDLLAQILAQISYPIEVNRTELYSLIETCQQFAGYLLTHQQSEAMLMIQLWLGQKPENLSPTLFLELLLYWLRELLLIKETNRQTHFAEWTEQIQKQAHHSKDHILLAMDNVMIAIRLLSKPQYRPTDVLEQMVIATSQRQRSMDNGWSLITI